MVEVVAEEDILDVIDEVGLANLIVQIDCLIVVRVRWFMMIVEREIRDDI